jgi:integrase
MAVPERLRAAIGKREIKESLGTANLDEARVKHAHKLAEVRVLFASLDQQEASSIDDRADKIVREGLEALARNNIRFHAEQHDFDLARGVDHVSYTMLRVLGFRTRLDWGGSYAAQAQERELGKADDTMPLEEPQLGGAFPSYVHRDATSEHIALFEEQPKYWGAAFREVARALLAARDWKAAEFEAMIVAQAVGVILKPKGKLFDAIAERILRHLADHRFGHWPTGIDHVLNPMMSSMSAYLPEAQTASENSERHTLTEAFAIWKAAKGIVEGEDSKVADEWKVALDRFKELAGTEDIAEITRKMVKAYLGDVTHLPSRPKKEIGSLPLRQQIEAARAAKLLTLSPPTIGKHLAAIRSLLNVAIDEEWITTNPAAGLSVKGAKHTGTERDHYSDEDLHRIYTSPLMTDPDACSDTMFWILLLAPFQGSRPGEHCRLKPHEIVKDDGQWVMRFRVDRRQRGATNDLTARPRRQKTEASIRDMPLHWIVLEAGFLDWVALQVERGAEWVFDDIVPDRYGDRFKALSRKINPALRALGINDVDKSFYSSRHSWKREGRRRHVPEHELDQLGGHASLNVARKYGQGSPMATLKENLDRLEFRSVPWDSVVACAHRRILRLAEGVASDRSAA